MISPLGKVYNYSLALLANITPSILLRYGQKDSLLGLVHMDRYQQWRIGRMIFECGPWKELTLFDPITKETTELGCTKYIGSCQGIFVYRESLVSFMDRNGSQEQRVAQALA